LDAEEEVGAAGEFELGDVEEGVVVAREAVEGEHADDGGEDAEEDGEFEGDDHEGGPAVEGASADVDGVVDDGGVPLEEEAADAAEERAGEDDPSEAGVAGAEGGGEAVDGEGGVGVGAAVPLASGGVGGGEEALGGVELGEEAVD